MRLRTEYIEFLAKVVVNGLVSQQMLMASNPKRLEEVIRQVIVEDLTKEDELDDAALEMVERQLSKLSSKERDAIDVDEFFRLVKKQLAKERNMIL